MSQLPEYAMNSTENEKTSTVDATVCKEVQQFDKQLTSLFDSLKVPGVAVLVITKDKVLYKKEIGYANIEKKIPYTLDTVTNIASISKTFIGGSLAKAQEDGLLSLDEDINDILPFKVVNPYFPNEKITLKNLASHTSGIEDDETKYIHSYSAYGAKIMTLKDFLYSYLNPEGKWYSRDNFSNNKPGASFSYSNIGSALAGYCIEARSKMTYADYVRKNIFEKLSMNNSGWNRSEFKLANIALNYSKLRIDFTNHTEYMAATLEPMPAYELITYPDGGVMTTVNDLSKYLQAIMKRKDTFITAKSIDLMLQKQFNDTNVPPECKETDENIGLFWSYSSEKVWGHTGSDPGVDTSMYVNSNNVGLIAFINTDDSSLEGEKYEELVNLLMNCPIK
ncbi:serine hydrolase domain-containing protein [Lysinibacillus pakistanensis]|uniref:Serine hydrolase domain-containing protein n=1 Tax=Lysinibacillus pakistanensis TaxID=759811 RepID=A0AAX3X027_9BACI|nr:serine hydrolase domain-containing protein [Lysinibacillus pakistanensis]MDM5232815.1 serine hydrolase domain-containing protein [Lysinibacillus pakistanensis]WHY48313.1 serine hydrolase domain-containing protein [Lysinibacillus pakistanensis]WHY53326.1 serine hydrolase domain-containing protein [Lysinibacillus pakistanensis]